MDSKNATKVLVTGGSGFLGRGIVNALLERHPEWQISILDIVPPIPEHQTRISQFIRADVTSTESINNAFAVYRPDIVMHSAGIVPGRNLRYSTDKKQWNKVRAINYEGTQNVLNAAMATGCRKFVYTSSCTVAMDDLEHDHFNIDEDVPIGLATLHYGKSKGMAEQYVLSDEHREKGLKACALRPCTIIGPGDTAVISVIHDLIAKNETNFIIGDGENIYDFMYIDNAVDAHVLAIENILTTQTAAGQAMFISNQEPVYFWDFCASIWAHFGHVPKYRVHVPLSIAWLAGLGLECVTWFTGGASTIDRGSVRDAVRTHYSNNAKAIRILGYDPEVGLAEGVRRSCAVSSRCERICGCSG